MQDYRMFKCGVPAFAKDLRSERDHRCFMHILLRCCELKVVIKFDNKTRYLHFVSVLLVRGQL